MESSEIRRRFLDFFKARGHAVVPSSSLVPDDPSVLLTTAGMQQFKKYYTGELDPMKDFGSKNTASIQKSFRTSDIDEVGDDTHLTFFEMLGNFSFGGYWKKEAIAYAHEFLTKELGLPISYVTVFKGSDAVPKDEESKKIWRELGVTDIREEGMEDVFWGPTGTSGPCGPTTEIYCKDASGHDVEIWNIVFNEFFSSGSREELLHGASTLKPLAVHGIDTGMGLERLATVSQKAKNIFGTDLFAPLIAFLSMQEKLERGGPTPISEREKRIFADHMRAIVFLIADGVRPSNKEAGYILRRLVRRILALNHARGLGSGIDCYALMDKVIEQYDNIYQPLDRAAIRSVLREEEKKFGATLDRGLKQMKEYGEIDGKLAFKLYESYGLPYEMIKDLGGDKVKNLSRADFDKEFEKHQELSRAGTEKKFGGHGLILDTGELKAGNEADLAKVLRLHTATHLLQAALREVLGPDVHQMGSDITPERTRFDFSFSRKLTQDEIKKTEAIVNAKIAEDLPVGFKEMPKTEAEHIGALHFFREKYPERVKVYYVGRDLASAWSKEFCGGPHVTHTGEIGQFRIAKEEAVGSGVRRIRGVVE